MKFVLVIICILVHFAKGELQHCNTTYEDTNFTNTCFHDNSRKLNYNYKDLEIFEKDGQQLLCYWSDTYIKDLPPSYPELMELYLSIYLYEITNVNDMDHTISMTCTIEVRWKDNRLGLGKNEDGIAGKSGVVVALTPQTSNELWKPNLKISGLRDMKRDVRSVSLDGQQKLR